MSRQWRLLWLVIGGVVCLDWLTKMWLLSAFLCRTCHPASVVLTSAPPSPLTERISQAGIRCGERVGVTLAIVLFPEPCG
jgi:hypothetical protein